MFSQKNKIGISKIIYLYILTISSSLKLAKIWYKGTLHISFIKHIVGLYIGKIIFVLLYGKLLIPVWLVLFVDIRLFFKLLILLLEVFTVEIDVIELIGKLNL